MHQELLVVCYIILINVVGFILMFVDKQKAIKHKWRIPEKTLFAVAILGGSIGGWIGMYTFRHKTKHASFVIGYPSIVIIQGIIGYCLYV